MDLHTAFRERLVSDAGMAALVDGRVYDGTAPPDRDWPYVVIDTPTEVQGGGVMGMRGLQNTLSAHAFSRIGGYDAAFGSGTEARSIVKAMDAAVREPIPVNDHTDALLRLDFATLLVEGDGVRHAPVRFRVQLLEVA